MTRPSAALSILVAAVLGSAPGCDIIYSNPPVTAAQATGIFADITTRDDSHCGVILGDDPAIVWGFTNFDKTGVGASVDFVVLDPAGANVAGFSALTAQVSRPDDFCGFTISGEVRYEQGEPAPAPDASQRLEDFAPVVIYNALFPAQDLCTDPIVCGRQECDGTIPESRLVDVRMFCNVSGAPSELP